MREILLSFVVAIAAYLLGCIATGLIIAGKAGVNLRAVGSKSTGASNVLRVMGAKKGAITFLGDFTKALLACLLGRLLLPSAFGIDNFGAMLGGLFAILGHNWPAFFGFKGGKGVACSAAIVLFVNPLWGVIAGALCLAVIATTRFISLGSMTLLFSYMVLMCIHFWGQWFVCAWTLVLFLLCVYQHRANIGRLVSGTENKIGNRVKAKEEPTENVE